MVSYYLPIHFMALNAIPKKTIGGSYEGSSDGEQTEVKTNKCPVRLNNINVINNLCQV